MIEWYIVSQTSWSSYGWLLFSKMIKNYNQCILGRQPRAPSSFSLIWMFIPSFLEALLWGRWGERGGGGRGECMSLVWNSDTVVSCFEKWAISLLLFLMSLVASSLRPCHLSEFDRNRACILVCPSQPRPQGTFPWLLKRPGDGAEEWQQLFPGIIYRNVHQERWTIILWQ